MSRLYGRLKLECGNHSPSKAKSLFLQRFEVEYLRAVWTGCERSALISLLLSLWPPRMT